METIKVLNYVIMLLFFLCYSYQFLYIPISLFHKKKEADPGKLHHYAVLIAARNEEAVIGNLIDSLKAQNYPQELLNIYVVADHCTDNTAEVAKAHGATVFSRSRESHRGKGYALHYLLGRIDPAEKAVIDGYLIFDADNIVDENYVREINKTFSQGFEIITSYRNTKNYGDNWISAGYGLWFLREARYLNQPRNMLGSSCAVSGTGFLLSARVLEECGGWNFYLLTEDIEFTADRITAGEKIGYCPTAIFYDEQPQSFHQSVTQRLRWARGYLQVLHKYGTRLFRGACKGSFSCFDMLMNIAPAAILTIAGLLLNFTAAILALLGGSDISVVGVSLAQSFLNIYLTMFVLGLITTISEWRQIRCAFWKKIAYCFTFPLFMMTYIPIAAAALFCHPEWRPIRHGRVMTLADIRERAR